jgi:cytidylate kinase
MSNPLIKYFSERYLGSGDLQKDPGPVVTISREFGCPAKLISDLLAYQLNEMQQHSAGVDPWHVISKEILDESARELKTESAKIEYVFNYEKKSIIDEFLESLSAKYYHSDWKIRDTIKNVIRGFGVNGHVIIIGRAAAQINRDIEKSLHIRLVAPFEWRVNHFATSHNITPKEAIKKIKELDENREKLIKAFATEGNCIQCYDVFYSTEYLTNEQIVASIVQLMQLKNLI